MKSPTLLLSYKGIEEIATNIVNAVWGSSLLYAVKITKEEDKPLALRFSWWSRKTITETVIPLTLTAIIITFASRFFSLASPYRLVPLTLLSGIIYQLVDIRVRNNIRDVSGPQSQTSLIVPSVSANTAIENQAELLSKIVFIGGLALTGHSLNTIVVCEGLRVLSEEISHIVTGILKPLL